MAIRRPVRASALALTALLTSACGGVDGSAAPTNATEVDFCLTWVKQVTDFKPLFTESLQSGEMPSGEEFVEVMDAWVSEMLTVGTPATMPDDARTRFEAWLEEDLDPDDFDAEELADESFDPTAGWDDLSSDEFNNARELTTYLQSTCNPLYRERGLL